MVVNTSPRQRDSFEYGEPEETDPRFTLGFRSLSLSVTSSEYEHHESIQYDHRPFAATQTPGAGRRLRRQRRSDQLLHDAQPFQYRTIADGDVFRLAILLPGKGSAPVECRLIWESSRKPKADYRCLSYCWGTENRDAAILCDGYRFSVTKSLLKALQNLRDPRTEVRLWIDQICINQEDHQERAHQVSIMKHIFSQAKEVTVWLGEEDDRSEALFQYAKKMARGESVKECRPRSALNKILKKRELQDAIQKLLQRQWFSRVWVIPEVALARFTVVHCGNAEMSWDNLVRLIRDAQLPESTGFDKQTALLGNARQRIAIISQMIASRRAGLLHTDITQLLILAKSSQATDVRDMVYAFYGLTLLTTFPDYRETPDRKTSIERLYVEIARYYVSSILWDDYYSRWHGLSEQRRTQQLMSILYSAGRLHQHHESLHLPSWVPDWTFAWYQAPIWCKTESNIAAFSGRDDWSLGIRCNYRAGGPRIKTFDITDGAHGLHLLRLSAIVFDFIVDVYDSASIEIPAAEEHSPFPSVDFTVSLQSPVFTYGREYFKTAQGLIGIATRGIQPGDAVAILLGGDVPTVLRPCNELEGRHKAYTLLCECFVQSGSVMDGSMIRTDWPLAEDIVLI